MGDFEGRKRLNRSRHSPNARSGSATSVCASASSFIVYTFLQKITSGRLSMRDGSHLRAALEGAIS